MKGTRREGRKEAAIAIPIMITLRSKKSLL